MPSSSSSSSSSDAHNSGSSSGSSSGSDNSWNLISETSLSYKILIALEASQASMDGAKVGSSRCPHDLGFTTLRVKSLGDMSLARPSLLLRGRSWGRPDLYLSPIPLRLYPHISETFKLPYSYGLRVLEDTKTVS